MGSKAVRGQLMAVSSLRPGCLRARALIALLLALRPPSVTVLVAPVIMAV